MTLVGTILEFKVNARSKFLIDELLRLTIAQIQGGTSLKSSVQRKVTRIDVRAHLLSGPRVEFEYQGLSYPQEVADFFNADRCKWELRLTLEEQEGVFNWPESFAFYISTPSEENLVLIGVTGIDASLRSIASDFFKRCSEIGNVSLISLDRASINLAHFLISSHAAQISWLQAEYESYEWARRPEKQAHRNHQGTSLEKSEGLRKQEEPYPGASNSRTKRIPHHETLVAVEKLQELLEQKKAGKLRSLAWDGAIAKVGLDPKTADEHAADIKAEWNEIHYRDRKPPGRRKIK